MTLSDPIWNDPETFLAATRPELPVLCVAPRVLQARYRASQQKAW